LEDGRGNRIRVVQGDYDGTITLGKGAVRKALQRYAPAAERGKPRAARARPQASAALPAGQQILILRPLEAWNEARMLFRFSI